VSEGLLAIVEGWYARNELVLRQLGLNVSLTLGPTERPKQAVWIDFDSVNGSARLTVWSSGEAALYAIDFATSEILTEHREISSETGLDDAEAAVRRILT
jgi:hypothetical protein